ncbi:DUF4011 domain-containing protein [Pseudomonas oryzihabitans]|uniref:DUF4011 domain-containing protein n=1 Tax=Pseudomonas oryzihabitans TaxID=47885 RepID=UPI00214DFB52|nr:DUF4011 domain-containing protein [Pseudomonas psychrotolerans]UUW72019.1 DUF4011 domain-containing protein [Pseudomonas psychrotolerans]
MSVDVELVLAGKIGFAAHQNAVPVLRELRLTHSGQAPLADLSLTVTAEPAFVVPRTWHLERLDPQGTLYLDDRDLEFDAALLGSLQESLVAQLTFTVRQGDEILQTRRYPVELLARNQWGGVDSMPELAAAFVMPNDPAVDRLLGAAAEVLRRAGKSTALDGYEGESRRRVWELGSALWSALCGLQLTYAVPPASFERQGQKIRTPGAILDGGLATCLDLALLACAALEQAGLNPLLVITRGHAFAGVWLQPQEFAQLLTDDAEPVRKRVALKDLLVFETTQATASPPPSFSQAVQLAERQLDDETFVLALDVRRARLQRIRPLAVPGQLASPLDGLLLPGEALEEAPPLPAFDVDVEAAPTTPVGRLALWQRKLLDLTTRNRLLHVPENARSVPLLCPEPAALEDRLAEGRALRLVPLPDLAVSGRDAVLHEAREHENLEDEYARGALARGEVVAPLDATKLDAALVELYRRARSDLDEGGANTLYLALGFLRWKKAADDPKHYRAPLILLPVRLERQSAASGITLHLFEDEPRFNLTLLELLRHDFDLDIPGLDGPLPGDGNGIDVDGIWTKVRRAVRDLPGFEVSSELLLGQFSFAKYLMWKDLTERSDQLMESPLVRHLLERTTESGAYLSGGSFPRERELDRQVTPAELFTPLPADSSQLAAVLASAGGQDFVLDGPPGTGKSQTIANMIAHNLALGRRVLFVAEKRAALDVVYRRLEAQGLGEFCLELHSSKASKAEVLKQLERAWDTRDGLDEEEWLAEAAEVERLRDRLNAVVERLHRRWPNGLTLQQSIGRVLRDAAPDTPRLAWSQADAHDAEALAELRTAVRRLALHAETGRSLAADFALLPAHPWSNAWQDALVTAAERLRDTQHALQQARQRLRDVLGLPLADQVAPRRLLEFAELLRSAAGQDLAFAFGPGAAERQRQLGRALELLRDYQALERELSVPYAAEACRRVALTQLETAWDAAARRFWIFASRAQRQVTQDLARQGETQGQPDVAADLPRLRRQRTLLTELDDLAPTLAGIAGWQGVTSDLDALLARRALAERLSTALPTLAETPEQLLALRQAAARRLQHPEDQPVDTTLAPASSAFAEALDAAEAARQAFAAQAGLAGDTAAAELVRTAAALLRQPGRLKAWCDWQRVREEADALGLAPLIARATTAAADDLPTLFETAYARWFAATALDAEPLLRDFVPAEHESDIQAYRRLDDRLQTLAVRHIRALLCHGLPPKNDAARQGGGFAVLKHELQKQRRHRPLRQLALEMGDALARLAPCMLMSPLSIAQYLPPDGGLFDLVIFDEASQIAPWDAVGAIARGVQVVIAGDPRQMPPTRFFDRAAGEDDTAEDLESILDECLGAGIYSHSLNWHYRSRHESLIAFSNHHYYDGKLITFPAPEIRPSAVEWRRVDGVYAKGKGRHNAIEAQAMVAEAVKRLLDPAFAGLSLGIITLNSEQQRLVTDLLDRARQQHPEIEAHFAEDLAEPVVVKNLETVQGDERDLIMLGIGFGPTEPGANTMSMNFGPLNKDGGWRRLNVAVTRARREMLVFSSFDPGLIDLNRTNARAVRDLKLFLEFAQRGPQALAAAVKGSLGGHDSPFEEAVAQALQAKGWRVVPQIGVSRFRIDLGIVHPDRPGDYLVGIECDGATYHSAATARDRDKTRSAILQGLGWTLLRVWSTEWWIDRAGATERLHGEIERLLEESRAKA